jgi:hypothetical protein
MRSLMDIRRSSMSAVAYDEEGCERQALFV